MNKNVKHVLVAGGAGFIGSHLTKRLFDQGKEVTVIDDLSNGKKENIPKAANFIYADLANEETFNELEKVSFTSVFHLAAQTSGSLFCEPDCRYEKSSPGNVSSP